MTDDTVNTHTSPFGFVDLDPAKKVEAVRGVFESVAPSYDLMNDVMSAGIHHLWKDAACDKLNPQPNEVILDVAGGTGDIARRLFRRADNALKRRLLRGLDAKPCDITIIDYNEEMIRAGRAKKSFNQASDLKWVVGDAINLPIKDASIDAYIISFGIRNVADIAQALKEAKRVLRPGGRFFCLEFSKPVSSLIEAAYKEFSFKVIPLMGELIAKDRASYQYLVESIQRFPDQESFLEMMKAEGFHRSGYQNYSNGIACLHFGCA